MKFLSECILWRGTATHSAKHEYSYPQPNFHILLRVSYLNLNLFFLSFELLSMRLALYSSFVMTCFSRLSVAAPGRELWVLNEQEKGYHGCTWVSPLVCSGQNLQPQEDRSSSKSCNRATGYHFVPVILLANAQQQQEKRMFSET